MNKPIQENINWDYLSHFVQIPEPNKKLLIIHRFKVYKVVPKADYTLRSGSRVYYLFSSEKSKELAITCLYQIQNKWFVNCSWRSKYMDEELLRYITAEIISKLTIRLY